MNIRTLPYSLSQYTKNFIVVCNGMLKCHYFFGWDLFDSQSPIFVRYQHYRFTFIFEPVIGAPRVAT